jgi:hypothetical protein
MPGANKRTRTADLRITNALLYQLSYVGLLHLAALLHTEHGEVTFLHGVVKIMPACVSTYGIFRLSSSNTTSAYPM